MAREKITIPPVVTPPVEVGEIDLNLVVRMGQIVCIESPRRLRWTAHAIPFADGSLLFVPEVSPTDL